MTDSHTPDDAGIVGPTPQSTSSRRQTLIIVGVVLGVFVMIGVTIAVAIPVFFNQRSKTVASNVIADVSKTATAMYNYRAVQYVFPTTTSQLQNSADKVTLSKGTSLVVATNGKTGFCIAAINTSGPYTSGSPKVYDSGHGGLQPDGSSSCSIKWTTKFLVQ